MTADKPGVETITLDGRETRAGIDPRRMSHAELRAAGHDQKPVLTAMRERCIDCCGGNEAEVRRCLSISCAAWPFRMGTNPWREKRAISEQQRQALALARTKAGANPA